MYPLTICWRSFLGAIVQSANPSYDPLRINERIETFLTTSAPPYQCFVAEQTWISKQSECSIPCP